MTRRRVRVRCVEAVRARPFNGQIDVVLNGETSTGAETCVTLVLDCWDVGALRRLLADEAIKMGNIWHEAAR